MEWEEKDKEEQKEIRSIWSGRRRTKRSRWNRRRWRRKRINRSRWMKGVGGGRREG